METYLRFDWEHNSYSQPISRTRIHAWTTNQPNNNNATHKTTFLEYITCRLRLLSQFSSIQFSKSSTLKTSNFLLGSQKKQNKYALNSTKPDGFRKNIFLYTQYRNVKTQLCKYGFMKCQRFKNNRRFPETEMRETQAKPSQAKPMLLFILQPWEWNLCLRFYATLDGVFIMLLCDLTTLTYKWIE